MIRLWSKVRVEPFQTNRSTRFPRSGTSSTLPLSAANILASRHVRSSGKNGSAGRRCCDRSSTDRRRDWTGLLFLQLLQVGLRLGRVETVRVCRDHALEDPDRRILVAPGGRDDSEFDLGRLPVGVDVERALVHLLGSGQVPFVEFELAQAVEELAA